ncbi:hypothetical protein [Runella slithyformis]|uniref:hypothetical protein n=1 Tax=Runella slithyformis TaxID=106 RepID=UPI00059CE629|nr:hypothetical protein [Runella slithyformis]
MGITTKSYVCIDDLPVEQQAAFRIWLGERTVPIIEEEGEQRKDNCAWIWDYERWYECWVQITVSFGGRTVS